MNTATFTVGQRYTCRSAANRSITWTYEVTKRTAKFITIQDVRNGDSVRVGVKVSNGREWAMPQGSFSMAPVITAEA